MVAIFIPSRFIFGLGTVLGLFLMGSHVIWAAVAAPIKIYIDADFSLHKTSAISIERGIKTALDEVGNELGNRPVEIVRKDHRGSTPRSTRNLKQFLNDPDALLVFAGLHSPPLLANREFINTNQILTLDPWAAAGPITRFPSQDNWIFRLSIDDSKAGRAIVDHVVKVDGFKKPYLLLEDTGWGKSNERTMLKAIKHYQKQGVISGGVEWFNWNLGAAHAKQILMKIADSGADVILLVANVPDGVQFMNVLLELPKDKQLPIRSHWGISGGDLTKLLPYDKRKRFDLAFLQTTFSFVSQPNNVFGQQVFHHAQQLFPQDLRSPVDLEAPAGFIHAYDLTKILIQTVKEVGLGNDMKTNRLTIRKGLENVKAPVRGLIKIYDKPFGVFDAKTPDAHEALGLEDMAMGRYGKNGEIRLLAN